MLQCIPQSKQMNFIILKFYQQENKMHYCAIVIFRMLYQERAYARTKVAADQQRTEDESDLLNKGQWLTVK